MVQPKRLRNCKVAIRIDTKPGVAETARPESQCDQLAEPLRCTPDRAFRRAEKSQAARMGVAGRLHDVEDAGHAA
jgi:hypothetical protein